MRSASHNNAQFKQQAAEYAVQLVKPGMVVGLGTGSTALFAIRKIGELLSQGALQDVRGYPTSKASEAEARRLNIPVVDLENPPPTDLTIDGADEVDPQGNLIKGGGGALLREKIVAQASRREIIVVDESKLSTQLGAFQPVPVEVIPFGWKAQMRYLESLGALVSVRQNPDGMPFWSDENHLILDCAFGPLQNPQQLAGELSNRAGIVEHGLFLGLCTDLVIAGKDGVRHVTCQT